MRRTHFKPHMVMVAVVLVSCATLASTNAWAGDAVYCFPKDICDLDGDGYAGWPNPRDAECKPVQVENGGIPL